MSHKLAHTIRRGKTYVYNRRVPERISNVTEQKQIRVALGADFEYAKTLSRSITERLDQIWKSSEHKPVDVQWLISTARPRTLSLKECAKMYLAERSIQAKPTELAVRALASLAGDRDVRSYTRVEARKFAQAIQDKGCKSATVRRRIQSLHAVIEYGLLELDSSQRNPFARISILQEGLDATKRGVFTTDQLRSLYAEAQVLGKDTFQVFPIIGETGARLAEIVGLRWQDVDFENRKLTITPHRFRRLKTKSSEREVPLVGRAFETLHRINNQRDCSSEFVFPRWKRENGIVSTHASNTLNGILKRRFGNLTCHCFRHTFRDRMRAVNAPPEMIDALGGWTLSGGVGVGYGFGYAFEEKTRWMKRITI